MIGSFGAVSVVCVNLRVCSGGTGARGCGHWSAMLVGGCKATGCCGWIEDVAGV